MGNNCCAARKIPTKNLLDLEVTQTDDTLTNVVENDNSSEPRTEPSLRSKSLGCRLVMPKRKAIPDLNISESPLYLKRKGQVIGVNAS
jgi:hypothetical protein